MDEDARLAGKWRAELGGEWRGGLWALGGGIGEPGHWEAASDSDTWIPPWADLHSMRGRTKHPRARHLWNPVAAGRSPMLAQPFLFDKGGPWSAEEVRPCPK